MPYIFNIFTGNFDYYQTATSGSQILYETPSGSINGSNTAFTVANVPAFLTMNGQVIVETVDYTISGLSITTIVAPPTGSIFRSYYITSGSIQSEIPVGSVDGSNATFTVTNTVAFLTVNGQVMTLNVDYTLSGNTITMSVAPPTGSILRSYFIQ